MNINPQAAIHHKCRELIMLLNVNLNHFPRHEKYGLCQELRTAVYGVLGGLVECQKKYHNKTSLTKDEAHTMRHTIEDWLKDTLHLELSKWIVQPVKRGLNFVGFRTWRKTRFVRKHTLCKFSRNLRASNVPAVVSALGHARHTATWRHFAQRILSERPDIVSSLPLTTRLSFQGALDATV